MKAIISSAAGETTARRLMQEYGVYLKRLCFLYLCDAALAEDAVQETFLKALRALDDFRGQSSERTWLSRIAINVCRDFRRASWYRLFDARVALEQVAAPAPQGEGTPEGWDDTVLQAVMRLGSKYKEVVLLRYYQGLSLNQVAQALDASVPTVSTRLLRARHMLKDSLKGWYFDEE